MKLGEKNSQKQIQNDSGGALLNPSPDTIPKEKKTKQKLCCQSKNHKTQRKKI